jgi:hypothetical protein
MQSLAILSQCIWWTMYPGDEGVAVPSERGWGDEAGGALNVQVAPLVHTCPLLSCPIGALPVVGGDGLSSANAPP